MPNHGDVDNSYPSLLVTENKIQLLEPFKGAKAHHKMCCLTCDHVWEATPLSKRQAFKKNGVSGCPVCNETKKQQKYSAHRVEVLAALSERGVEILDPTYDGRLRLNHKGRLGDEKILVRNRNCGHEFSVTPLNLIQSEITCSVCGVQNRISAATSWSKSNSVKWQETAPEWQRYKSIVTNLTKQVYAKNTLKINPKNLPRGKAGQEGCYHLDHRVPTRFCFDNQIPPEVCASVENLQMMGWKENVGCRDHLKGSIPPMFFKYLVNADVLQHYANLLQSVFPDGQLFVSIGETVATLFDVQTNIAIIVLPLNAQYANLKTAIHAKRSVEEQGIKCIQIFEDEFQNLDLIKLKLLHYAGKNTGVRLHARQLSIRETTKTEKRDLLNQNHLQGNDGALVNVGAYHGDKLVAVMTFTPPRVALGQRSKTDRTGIWELSRFCTDVEYKIPGVASRLLKWFQQHHTWTEIYSYADKRWSIGGLYERIGFTLVSEGQPDYFYVVNGVRKHRWNYRKDVIKTTLPIFDPMKTEYENMVINGFWRVWDCGSLKYVLTNRPQ